MKRFDVIIRVDAKSDINKYVKIVKNALSLFFFFGELTKKKTKSVFIGECEIDQNENTKEALIEVSW